MARKVKSSSPQVDTPDKNVPQGKYWLPPEAKWGGFINIRLSDEQKEEFRVWLAEYGQHVAGYLDDALSEGIKFGAAADRENACFVVTFTGALVDGSNERYCCTSRNDTLNSAIALAVWKHEVLAGGDYGNFSPRTGDFLKFG